jgi:cell division protein FtsL
MEHEDANAKREQKKKTRRLTRRKLFETILSIGLVILMGFFVMLLLYPQTEISELARDNSNLKDQINTAKREIVNAEENANGVTDMDVIRAQAIALGMQDPNQNQVINLPIPNTDSLRTRANYNSDGIDEDEVNDSKDALADYYAAHPEK